MGIRRLVYEAGVPKGRHATYMGAYGADSLEWLKRRKLVVIRWYRISSGDSFTIRACPSGS
jgi:hypothetical protein